VSNFLRCVGKKTALLQAEVSASVSGLANVLFCGSAVSFFSHCKITTVVSFLGLLVTTRLCVVRVSEALHFNFATKFLYLHNLSIYDEARITYEPLLWAGSSLIL